MAKVTVMRGLSGAGKSRYLASLRPTLVVSLESQLAALGPGHEVISMGRAMGECLRAFVDALRAGTPHIGVDSPNVDMEALAPYCALALAYGHELEIVTLRMPLDVAVARCAHRASTEVLEQQVRRLDGCTRRIPPYWRHREVQVD